MVLLSEIPGFPHLGFMAGAGAHGRHSLDLFGQPKALDLGRKGKSSNFTLDPS
jgi:hypothetical protein